MAQHDPHQHSSQSPTMAVLIALGMIMFFCTVVWIAARRQIANIYGVLRSIEFPLIWRYVPGSDMFGMPSAIPENGAPFEHYRAERVAKTPVSVPYIKTTIDGLRTEAEKYLDEDEIARIRETYGSQAIRAGIKEMDRIAPLERLLKDIAQSKSSDGASPGAARNAAKQAVSDAVDPFAEETPAVEQSGTPEPEDDPEKAMARKAREGIGKFF